MDWINTWNGFFLGESCTIFTLGLCALVFAFGFLGVPFFLWSLLILAALVGFGVPSAVILSAAGVFVLFNIKPLRQIIVSQNIMALMKSLGVIPKISETERTALEAGVVWNEAELFSGRPNPKKLMEFDLPTLTDEEQAHQMRLSAERERRTIRSKFSNDRVKFNEYLNDKKSLPNELAAHIKDKEPEGMKDLVKMTSNKKIIGIKDSS